MTLQFKPNVEFNVAEQRETHLSQVFLLERFVFKFKKAVSFPFCDYSTKEKRFQAAWDEVRLNRRGARDIYLGLSLFVYDSDGRLCCAKQSLLVTSEEVPTDVEYEEVAVVMARIPDTDFLEAKLNLESKTKLISEISRALALFFNKCERATDPNYYLTCLEAALRENISSLKQLSTHQQWPPNHSFLLDYLEQFQEEQLKRHRALLLERVIQGDVVDGHGDLRLDHLALTKSGVQIIDCVEFNPGLRLNDVISELAFLAVSFESRMETALAKTLQSCFAADHHDTEGQTLLPLFKTYRALVRAKVHALRSSQEGNADRLDDNRARTHYLSLATRNALGIKTPALILVSGLMGTGKSTLSEELSQIISGTVISSDIIRKESIGRELTAQNREHFGTGLYSETHTDRTYQELTDRSSKALERGEVVIVDATFLRRKHRAKFAALASQAGVIPQLLLCQLERTELLRRLAVRSQSGSAISEGRPELLDQQERLAETVQPDEGFMVEMIDMTSLSIKGVFRIACSLERDTTKG